MYEFLIIFTIVYFLYLELFIIFKIPRYLKSYFYLTLIVLSLSFYFYGMVRVDGVDFDNYVEYLTYPELVPDIGYKYILIISNYFYLNFTEILTIQGIFTLYAIRKYSLHINTSFILSFAIFVLHSAVVRDFSQSRVGLAVAFLFMAYSYGEYSIKRLFFIFISIMTHLTVLPAIFIFWICDKLSSLNNKKLYFLSLISFFFALLSKGKLIPILSAIDPRVDIYLNWSDDYYGNPVIDYSQFFFYLLLLWISIYAYKLTNDIIFKKFSLYIYAGIIVFISFSDVAIFAYRIAHLTSIFYPFILAKIFIYCFIKNKSSNFFIFRKNDIQILAFISSILILFIGLRPANYEVIRYINSYI